MDIKSFISTPIFGVLIVILIGYTINFIINSIYSKTVKDKSINKKYLKNIIQAIVIIICTICIFNMFEATKKFTSVILASSSLMVAVLGFAAQESLSNIINGFFISIFKPFEIGDRISLKSNNLTGEVEDISLRHTIIRTVSNSRVIVPNTVMNKEIIENSHFRDTKACNFLDVQVSYNSDIEKAMQIMSELIGRHELYLDVRTEEEIENGIDKVPVLVRELSNTGVHLRASVWTSQIATNFRACSDLRLEIKNAFDKEGITIPYNRIHIVDDKSYSE